MEFNYILELMYKFNNLSYRKAVALTLYLYDTNQPVQTSFVIDLKKNHW